MAEYIDKKVFLAKERKQYCPGCERRKGIKNGKRKIIYEIGEAPCRSCGINDILEDIDSFPTSEDVKPVVLCRDCVHFQQFRPNNGICKIDGMLWNNDFFCANGKREES